MYSTGDSDLAPTDNSTRPCLMHIPTSYLYALNVLLLLFGLLGLRLNKGERLFSLSLIQVLLGLPLLAGEYLYLASHYNLHTLQVVLFSEVAFSLIWLTMALRLRRATHISTKKSRLSFPVEIVLTLMAASIAGYFFSSAPGLETIKEIPFFKIYSPAYFSALFILLVVLYVSWRLEQFWRGLKSAQRWEYKSLVIGNLLTCGVFAWISSYRLTYLHIIPAHILLSAILLLFGWVLMLYAVLHHKLLNRKFFVSRKIVSTFAIPSLLAVYLASFGVISLLMRTFGLEMTFIVQWLLIVSGIIAAILFTFSGKTRRRIHFYISTHFYVNKYEYRDEWLALSGQLQGALTEKEVVRALRQVLAESLYTTEIFIWLQSSNTTGYRVYSTPKNPDEPANLNTLAADTPLIQYLQTHSYFHLKEIEPDAEWHTVKHATEPFLTSLHLRLISSISVGNQLIGLIGLGPEYTGGRYGHDDFDLLTVLGSQTASALLAVRMAEELAHAREQQAWSRLSAFVLHDIKNAATMLSMLQENAPEHIHEPEFQQDMLELVDDTLRRMSRVEQRLLTLKDEISPALKEIELCSTVQKSCRRLQSKLQGMKIKVESTDTIQLHTDPELLFSILENLLLNAFQAGGKDNSVQITVHTTRDQQAEIEIIDHGPGIAEGLLPDELFKPFTTNKKEGSGIGLWQAQKVAASLGGTLSASNMPEGGARFLISLPMMPAA